MKKYLLTAILALTTLLQADYVLKYQMDTEEQTFMYHSDKSSKMINKGDGEKREIYRIGKKIYAVSYDNGRKKVIDMDEMRKMSQSMGYDASQYQEEIQKPKLKVKKTGKRVTVGGVRGEVWIVSGVEDGKKFKEELIVTKDRRVVKTARAMFDLFMSMSGVETESNFLEIQKGYITIKAEGMELKSFSEKKVASSEYQIPKDAKKQKVPNFGKMQSKAVDSCYKTVCCGSTSGDSEVLVRSLSNNFRGYQLVGSGVCDALGLGSLLGITSVEGALYKKGADYIQVTLNMDDTEGGILRKTKKNLDDGYSAGLVTGIKNYSANKKVDGVKVIQGELLPMKQETLEYIIDSKTSLTISRLRKNNKGISLLKVVSSSGGVNMKQLKRSIKSSKDSKASESSENSSSSGEKNENENKELDAAVNLLKSFF